MGRNAQSSARGLKSKKQTGQEFRVIHEITQGKEGSMMVKKGV